MGLEIAACKSSRILQQGRKRRGPTACRRVAMEFMSLDREVVLVRRWSWRGSICLLLVAPCSSSSCSSCRLPSASSPELSCQDTCVCSCLELVQGVWKLVNNSGRCWSELRPYLAIHPIPTYCVRTSKRPSPPPRATYVSTPRSSADRTVSRTPPYILRLSLAHPTLFISRST